MFDKSVDLIYPIEVEIRDITDTAMSVSYLDLHIEIDNDGRLRTKLYIAYNIPVAPTYGVYISQLIRYP